MANRLDKTAADYIAIAVGPALIMTMVGSLVYFLLEVFYQGDYEERLQWIMACFVFAAVLIGRISIQEGTARAALFAMALALAMGLAIAMLVEHRGPLASIGLYLDWALLGVIWWCAHKLTWDCTFIDEQQPDTGEGLLQTIGLDDEAQAAAAAAPPEVAERIAAEQNAAQRLAEKRRLEGTSGDGDERPPKSRWERWFTGDERPHAPGLWVVYFSLAALPIFGIGQLFVPAANEARRQYVFQLLAVYVASGLGLLLTTSFLGMRRYLRQRCVEMPPRVAGKWIALGAGLGLGLLVLAVLLPRPNAEYAVSSLTGTIGSPQREASRYAPPGGEGAKDPAKQASSATTQGKSPPKTGDDATKSGGGGSSSDSKTGDSGSGSKTGGGGSASKTTGRGGEPNQKTESSSTTADNGGAKTPSSGEGNKTASSGAEKSSPSKSGAAKTESASSGGGEPPKQGEKPGGSGQGDKKEDDPGSTQNPSTSSPSSRGSSSFNFHPLESLSSSVSWLPTLLKWAFHGIIIAIVAFLAWRHRRELLTALAGFWNDLRNLLASLLGAKKKERPAPEQSPAPSVPRGRPFADYPNPFASGLAGRLSADQLVAYTFEALEAWAREHGCPRGADQTPLEFAAELGAAAAPLADHVRLLALLYSQMAYAPGTLRAQRTEELEHLWRLLGRG